ncbi:MAG: 3-hydroxyacyl-CoA dehydrogenase family protein [Deltaproteobacteria bacterium]|uniref:3-hydroxyacyl-CoA dehydrogenase family protein n=1 Tax=Candidatus Zymogenus saltonus TaxID=2844893 RepID=A0A9D8KDK3_9DELT|nr:3-hydroxyacyl-CoA dehydrogenase family protein [Candidatus Zymogenus saltonus]
MEPVQVKRALVIGAGVMGHSIAQVFAQSGVEVALVDRDKEALTKAKRLIKSNLETLAEFGHVDPDGIDEISDRVYTTRDLQDAAIKIDFAVEAVSEVPEVKEEVFLKLDALLPENVILASNTSGIDIFSTVKVKRPERLIIAHWFAPPHIIPLVEVVPGPETSKETVAKTAGLMERLGKKPVVMSKFTRSFIVNKIQNNISLAVFDLLENGWATPEDIDFAVKTSLGIRLPVVGVAQTLDFTGLDLVNDVIKSYGLQNKFIDDKVNRGHLGAKTSKGMHDYGGRTEEEILKKRDRLYLKVLELLEDIKAFEPV